MLSSSTFCRLDRTKTAPMGGRQKMPEWRHLSIWRHSSVAVCSFHTTRFSYLKWWAYCNLALTKLSPVEIPPQITDSFNCKSSIPSPCGETATKIFALNVDFIIFFYFQYYHQHHIFFFTKANILSWYRVVGS
jgi:hypothetical protein